MKVLPRHHRSYLQFGPNKKYEFRNGKFIQFHIGRDGKEKDLRELEFKLSKYNNNFINIAIYFNNSSIEEISTTHFKQIKTSEEEIIYDVEFHSSLFGYFKLKYIEKIKKENYKSYFPEFSEYEKKYIEKNVEKFFNMISDYMKDLAKYMYIRKLCSKYLRNTLNDYITNILYERRKYILYKIRPQIQRDFNNDIYQIQSRITSTIDYRVRNRIKDSKLEKEIHDILCKRAEYRISINNHHPNRRGEENETKKI